VCVVDESWHLNLIRATLGCGAGAVQAKFMSIVLENARALTSVSYFLPGPWAIVTRKL